MSTDLNVNFLGIRMKTPIIAASGTFGFGVEYKDYMDLSQIGAISCKGIAITPWDGNEGVRIAETSSGILNCIGLENPGTNVFKKRYLPELKKYDVPVICNIVGRNIEEYGMAAKALSVEGVDAFEVNISCPNVKCGGIAFGSDPHMAAEVTKAVKRNTDLPVIMKLSPNVTDIVSIARAVEDAGADAVSLINTLLGLAIDVKTRRPVLGNVTGGLSGPAINLWRFVWYGRWHMLFTSPFVGWGGIMTGTDAVEFMMAGADTVQVGTASLASPYAIPKITDELRMWCEKNNISDVNSIVDTLQV